MLWVQYATQLEKDLSVVHWAGHTVMVNVLSDKHPSLNVSMNLDDHFPTFLIKFLHDQLDQLDQIDANLTFPK